MNITLFFTIFLSFTLIYTIIGILASRNITNITDYFLAGRNLGFFSVMFTLIATQLGGGMLLGTAQEAYHTGLYGIMYTLGMSLGFLMLGCGMAAKLQSFNVATTAELFETRYNSPTLKKIASLLSIITMGGILIGQVVGARVLLTEFGLFNEPIFIAFWLFVIFYTMIGGLKAVVVTDIFQVLFIIFLFSGIFIYSIWLQPQEAFTLLKSQKYFDPAQLNTSVLMATLFMPALFSLIEQDLAQRFFAARTKRIASFAALGATAFMLLFALIPIYFGMKAQILGLSIPLGKSPLLPMLQTVTTDLVLAFAICGIIAAITSTADSLLCAIGSNLVLGFNLQKLAKNPLTLSKYATLIIGLIALAVSYLVPQNIIRILIESYEVSVSCLLIPLVICYFKKDVKKSAAVGGVTGGFIGLIIFRLWTPPFSKELLTLFLSLGGYILGTMIPAKK